MNRKKIFSTRFIPLLMILVVAIAIFTSSVLAYYVFYSNQVPNEFTPAESDNPTPEKKDGWYVTVEDMGYPVYVRAMIVVTWQKEEDGVTVVHYKTPIKGTDYTLELAFDSDPNSKWTEDTSFYEDTFLYYYTEPVESGKATDVLVESYTEVEDNAPEGGYHLNIELIAQTVQAEGMTDDDTKTSWQDAWGLKVPIDPDKS